MAKRKPKPKPLPPPPVVLLDAMPRTIDVWGDPMWSIRDRDQRGPTCFNGISLRQYRVTVELVDEPIEVLRERLLELWAKSERNPHRWSGFERAAAELGMPKFDLMTMGHKLEPKP